MNRNSEAHFATNPTNLDMSRSRMQRNAGLKLTCKAGQAIPFYIDEVLPGDSMSLKTSKVVRMQSLIAPIFDNFYIDTYYFFVPSRLCWNHWKEFMGENTESAWIPQASYSVPQLTAPEGGWENGTIADYFGIPTKVPGLKVSALPFRAYSLIVNEWFRDQNLVDPCVIDLGDSDAVGSNGDNYITDTALGGKPYPVAKYFDQFTGALPAPQKGPAVEISIGQAGNIPVVANPLRHAVDDAQMTFTCIGKNVPYGSVDYGFYVPGAEMTSATEIGDNLVGGSRNLSTSIGGVEGPNKIAPDNLWAQLGSGIPVISINELRTAFQIQKFYEKEARSGSRYREILKGFFGVTSPDARMMIPEYLGGKRVPVSINQVVQQSETGSTPQGNTAAYSLTADTNGDFGRSFVEHGYVIGIMAIRYHHTYQQGLERFWSRQSRFDYYWPVFASLGEQAILNKEIYAQGPSVVDEDGTPIDDKVFGYQEAWYDYRYKPSRVAGEMRSNHAQSLDVWHLADDYSELPTLSADWIQEDGSVVNRVLALSENTADPFLADIYVENTSTRVMPLYSIPGLVDHH